jgi:two-component system sensor histidine kinase/response regulator
MIPGNKRPARLLVVDDQEENLNILGKILGRLGFDIILARDSAQALLELELHAIDLILLDVLMPGHDGFETCRLIRTNPRWAGIPIIFLSAADDKNLIVRALDAGGVDYVTKPFNQAELMSRVRTHLALKAASDCLKQLAEDKDELLGILAHDLKNHLGGMKMSVQLLHTRAQKQHDASLERMAANIHTATNQMFAFVVEFLANSAADRGVSIRIEPLWLHEVAAAAVLHFGETARRKGIALVHGGRASAPVAADRKALDQVLDNLISNALKFSPSGTTVRVLTADDPAVGGGAICRVQDEGPGFAAEDRPEMFQRYKRLSARPTSGEPSTGLGLSIVKKLMHDLGGRIECVSEPGAGAAFVLRLPTFKAEAVARDSVNSTTTA